MSDLAFIKMHGLGNDFVVLDARQGNSTSAAVAWRAARVPSAGTPNTDPIRRGSTWKGS